MKILFEIPDSVEASDSAFAKYFAEHVDAYSDALNYSGYGYDERDRVDELVVTSVELTDQSVKVHYQVKLSIYHGCQDVEHSDTEYREVTGKRAGRVFTFEKFAPPTRRTTLEEF